MAKRQKFNVTVVWEAVAEFTVMARDQVDAERIVGMRGLPWRKAVEGDSDRYQLIVEPADGSGRIPTLGRSEP